MSAAVAPRGPLAGLRVVEMGGLGPAPFACMMLADMGAEVVRVERLGPPGMEHGPTVRGRCVVALDLKREAHQAELARLIDAADVLVEGFRPGVMERLGLGPEPTLARNPRLVYARMTGWGQSGPLAPRAGHDINYIAVAGALGAMGEAARPAIPLNLVGDYGGGALYLVCGVLAAAMEARRSGLGQVVDCAITDGVVSLLSLFHCLQGEGAWRDERAANMLDGGAHYYNTYECADGRFIAVGAIEPQFYAQLCEKAGWQAPGFERQNDAQAWPGLRERAAELFRQRPREEWLRLFEGSDACVTAVNSLAESLDDPHLRARGSFIELDGQRQPAPAPRFSRTPSLARPSVAEPDLADLTRRWSRAPFPPP
jgi:alpha-methylacyl-CoA racemase